MRYQYTSSLYSPLPEAEDSSHAIPPWGNVYDPYDPINKTPVDPSTKGDKHFWDNTTKLIIVIAASVFFIITIITTVICCRKKKNSNTDEENLDMDKSM